MCVLIQNIKHINAFITFYFYNHMSKKFSFFFNSTKKQAFFQWMLKPTKAKYLLAIGPFSSLLLLLFICSFSSHFTYHVFYDYQFLPLIPLKQYYRTYSFTGKIQFAFWSRKWLSRSVFAFLILNVVRFIKK